LGDLITNDPILLLLLVVVVCCWDEGEAVGVVVALPRGPRPVLRLFFVGRCADDGDDVISVDDDIMKAAALREDYEVVKEVGEVAANS
jgi:hypothetical protein